MKTLIAFSGGIDSTYIAWKLLQEMNDEIVLAYFDQFYITEKNNAANGTSSVTTSLSALTSGHGKEFNAFYSVGGIWEV